MSKPAKKVSSSELSFAKFFKLVQKINIKASKTPSSGDFFIELCKLLPHHTGPLQINI